MYKKIVNLTFLPVFENKTALMKALLIPLICLILTNILLTTYPESFPISIFGIIMLTTINITIAIVTHRILLLGQNSVPTWGQFAFGGRELSFLIASFLIVIICIPIMFLSLIPTVGIFIAIFSLLVVFSRLSLVFPSIAIDEKLTLAQAWDFTKKYKLLTFFSIIIFPTVFSLIIGTVYTLIIGFLIGVISSKLYVLYPVLDMFMAVFIVSALSATYKVIKEQHPEYFENQANQTKQNDELIIHNNKEQHSFNINEYEIDFERLKQELIRQYEQLGFDKIVVDKEDSWMAKHPENDNAYIALSLKDNEYKIEAYNTQQADLEVFLFNNAKNN